MTYSDHKQRLLDQLSEDHSESARLSNATWRTKLTSCEAALKAAEQDRDRLRAALERLPEKVAKFDGNENFGNYFWQIKNEIIGIIREALHPSRT